MKQEVKPSAIAAAIVVVVLVLSLVCWRTLFPPPQQTNGHEALQRKDKKDGG